MERSRSPDRSSRAGLLLLIVIVVLLVVWWAWPSEVEPPAPAPAPPVVQKVEPPPEPTPSAVIDAGPEPVVEIPAIIPAPDAGTKLAARDAGSSVTQTKALSSTYYLKEGNKVPAVPRGQSPFLEICQREAEACAVNELFWDLPPQMALVELDTSGGDVVVTGLGKLKVGGNDRFWSCLERALKAASMVGVEPAKKWSCRIDLKTAVNDQGELVKKVSECLGPVTPATSIELAWDLVNTGRQVEIQHLKVSPDVPLDGYAQRCIEQAAAAAPRRFTQDTKPSFSQRHMVLTVMTRNEGAPSNQPAIPFRGPKR